MHLTGPAAEAAACDAMLTPVVTGQIDWQALDQLTSLWLTLHTHDHTRRGDGDGQDPTPARTPDSRPPRQPEPGRQPGQQPRRRRRPDPGDGQDPAHRYRHGQGRPACGDAPAMRPHGHGQTRATAPVRPPVTARTRAAARPPRRPRRGDGRHDGQDPGTATASLRRRPGPAQPRPPARPAAGRDCGIPGCLEATRQRLQATIARWSLDLVSGPGGLASCLRGTLLNAPFNTPSQPLDIGRTTRTIPPHLRTAVTLRDQHCQFPRCRQPASVCEVHHLIHWAHGGPTSLANLILLCRFHHQIAIHRWGWTITRHPDGTTTATAPDGRTLHSHSPPQQAA